MVVKNIQLTNYRNHKNINVELSDNINVIFGCNGVGKTNIVESVYFISYLKSFRTNSDKELINYDSDFAKIDLKTESNTYQVIVTNKSKKCSFNNSLIAKQSDYVGKLKSVVFSPETIDILLKSPSERRKYIDMIICMIDPTYIHSIREFNHLIKQRNDYLKQLYINNLADKTYLDVLNERFCVVSEVIYSKRDKLIKELQVNANSVFKNFFDYDLNLVYDIQKGIDLNDAKNTLLKKLDERYERELYLGTTTTGPTRDDLIFNIDGHNARQFASKGQQRIVMISLKLAEIDLIYNNTNEYPVLILDDVLSELDEVRQNYLFKVLRQKNIQTIITTTDINDIKNDIEFKEIIIESS